MTVSVPAGAQNSQVISLAGLGEPSRSGGPAGNLLVTIDITSPAGPTAPPPPLQPQPPPPVQVATPPLQEMRFSTSSSYPVRTEPITRASGGKVNIWRIGKRQLVAAIIGIVIYGFFYYLLDLLFKSTSNIFFSPYSPTLGGILIGLTLTIVFFFGAEFGPWVGLASAVVGVLLGDLIAQLQLPGAGYGYVGGAIFGFLPGLALLRTQGRYDNRRNITIAVIMSAIGIVIGSIFQYIGYTIDFHAAFSDVFPYLIGTILSYVFGLILLPFLLLIYNAIVTRRKPTSATP